MLGLAFLISDGKAQNIAKVCETENGMLYLLMIL